VPLLPLITVAAGIGIAYVSQTAHATKATYEVSRLSADQQRLRTQDRQLRDELARLQSSERIVAAAQQLGMEPASTWAYVASNPVHVLPVATQARVDLARDTDALRQLIAALSGVSGAEGSAGR
jgi:cell division protein FtsL